MIHYGPEVESMTVYIGPLQHCTSPQTELNSGGKAWGFNACHEPIPFPQTAENIKVCHDIAKKAMPYYDWFISDPLAHHRISISCRGAAVASGAVSVTQEELDLIVVKILDA